MTVFQAVVLGLVQGLAEFLPVSSSAHLALTPRLLGWEDPGLAFDVALHLGTLLALGWYFRRDWIAMAGSAVRLLRSRRVDGPDDRRLLQLGLATVPGAMGGLLLNDYAETVFRTPALIASALMAMGLLLWVVDHRAPRTRHDRDVNYRDALLIGCAQVFALIPGVSRSGSTMTAGRALGFERASAARFSFLMSMPITMAAVILKTPEAVRVHGLSLPLVAGIVAAAVSSWLAITVLLRFVSRRSFGVFAVYRLVFGAFVLVALAGRT